jgi:hypothetical protein
MIKIILRRECPLIKLIIHKPFLCITIYFAFVWRRIKILPAASTTYPFLIFLIQKSTQPRFTLTAEKPLFNNHKPPIPPPAK